MMPLIVICSQDVEFYLLLSHIMEVDGFTTMLAGSVEEVLALSVEKPLKAVVLDCRPDNELASLSGLIKQDSRTRTLPCVALVSPGAESQHIHLLRSGVDERFVRPFAPAALLEYLRDRLATDHVSGQRPQNAKSLIYSDVEMRVDAHRVHCPGGEILLGPIEFKLLRQMLQNPEKVFSRVELIEAGWPSSSGVGARTVDVHISQLRKLLMQRSRDATIRTVRLAGYALARRAR